tara:strand:+ start:6842 stop:7201 length:360 start_codon:yes stop_codon:yes gene_type:complete
MNRRPPAKFLLYGALSLSGILAWAGHFGLAYGVQHLVCQSALIPASLWHVILAAATGLFVACIALVFWNIQSRNVFRDPDGDVSQFYTYVTVTLLAVSLFGILMTAIAGFMIPVCDSLR